MTPFRWMRISLARVDRRCLRSFQTRGSSLLACITSTKRSSRHARSRNGRPISAAAAAPTGASATWKLAATCRCLTPTTWRKSTSRCGCTPKGGKVLGTPWLRVFHDTDRARHADPAVTAASIANLALLAFLRYPIHLWTIGVAQCANRIQWLIRNGRHRGILTGLANIPSRLWSNRHRRQPLPSAAVMSYFALRRRPIPAPLDAAIARADG